MNGIEMEETLRLIENGLQKTLNDLLQIQAELEENGRMKSLR